MHEDPPIVAGFCLPSSKNLATYTIDKCSTTCYNVNTNGAQGARHKTEKRTMNSYQIIEDNAGNLYLFVFDEQDNVAGGIINLEYAEAGEYNQVAEGLSSNPLAEIAGWDGHMDDAAATYEEVTGSEFGWAIVNNNGDLRTHKMGAAAQRYFGIEDEE